MLALLNYYSGVDEQAYNAGARHALNAAEFSTRFLRNGDIVYSNGSGERTGIDPLRLFHKQSARQLSMDERREQAMQAGGLATIGAGAGLTGLALGGQALERGLTPAASQKGLEPALRQHMEVPKDVRVWRTAPSALRAGYSPKARVVQLPKKVAPGIMAHEFGHASGKHIPEIPHLRQLGPRAVIPLALLSQLYTDPGSTATKALQYGPAALMAPMVAEEARASMRGVRGIYRAKGVGAAVRSLLSTVPALGTYAGMALTPLLVGKLMHSYMKK